MATALGRFIDVLIAVAIVHANLSLYRLFSEEKYLKRGQLIQQN